MKKIYRQDQSVEGEFISLLNRVRTNEPEEYDLERLNTKVIDFDPMHLDQGFICLCSENAPANAINQVRLDAIDSPSFFYQGIIEDDFKEKNLPNEMKLELKVGAQVMFLKNGNGYYNGKIGMIKDLTVDSILVEIKDDSGKKSVIPVERYEWQNIEYVFNDEKGQIESKVKGKFIQYPLKLAWAITIHKSQGLTFDKVAIDIVYRGNFFKPSGLVYVALSRCRTWDGIVLNRPLNRDSIHVDARVVEFAQLSTPSTMVDDMIHHGKANELYRRSVDQAKAGSFSAAFDSLLKALDFRYDLDRPAAKRLIRRYLHRLESEHGELAALRKRARTDRQRIDELEATEHRLIDELLEFESKLRTEKKERDVLKATIETLQAEIDRLKKG